MNNLLKGRKNVVTVKERVKRYIKLTAEGSKIIASGIELLNVVTQVTNSMLLDGSWKNVEFKKYDIDIETQKKPVGKMHPFIRVLNKTREVFLQMGFSEISSPIVESSFWDFDALFQPQDHPAREMQDTFYVKKPSTAKLPDKKIVELVRETHENGWTTGSKGWKYKWNMDIAKKNILRTHTTAATIRAVHRTKEGPNKFFIVGPVFRRETIDYKHLPLFNQIDGIIIDKKASFATLLGTVEAFYKKMGFEKFEFRPAFFPYTEPSVEIYVWHEKKKDWFEMGGAGIFRPEVTLPLGCSDTVLAWGLGMERLAMFIYELADIREIYMSDIKWLESVNINQSLKF
jgi:phenylalanyl-tRNA synthetase alpha chain